MTATYAINTELNGIEISFDKIPAYSIREELKDFGFKWHRLKKIWYAKQTERRLTLAERICRENPAKPAAKTEKPKQKKAEGKPEKGNKYGVQVGDIFSCSWGYDQTNVDFFQVLKLCGEKSVRVRQVQPKMIAENAYAPMAAQRTYEITREILPPIESNTFITDQENGDLKRLKSYAADGVSDPVFEVGNGGYICHRESVGRVTHDESWGH